MADKSYKVVAPAAVARIGDEDRYLYRGAPLPAATQNVTHLLARGLIAEVKVATLIVADELNPGTPAQTVAEREAAAKAAAEATVKADAAAAAKAKAEAAAAAKVAAGGAK